MVLRALAARPIFPTLHCSPKHDKCWWVFAMSHLIQETSGSLGNILKNVTQFGETLLVTGQIYTQLCVSEKQRQAVCSNLQ